MESVTELYEITSQLALIRGDPARLIKMCGELTRLKRSENLVVGATTQYRCSHSHARLDGSSRARQRHGDSMRGPRQDSVGLDIRRLGGSEKTKGDTDTV